MVWKESVMGVSTSWISWMRPHAVVCVCGRHGDVRSIHVLSEPTTKMTSWTESFQFQILNFKIPQRTSHGETDHEHPRKLKGRNWLPQWIAFVDRAMKNYMSQHRLKMIMLFLASQDVFVSAFTITTLDSRNSRNQQCS